VRLNKWVPGALEKDFNSSICRFEIIHFNCRQSISMVSDFSALVENVITCPVCLKHFDQPRMLPCSHTFCFQCLHNMSTQNNGSFECPKRDGTKIQGNAIGALPSNEAICELVKLLRKYILSFESLVNGWLSSATLELPESNAPLCNRCGSKESKHWCDSDCKHCFCSSCWDEIHKVGQYRNHTKVPVKDRPPEIPRCQEEHDDKLEYWCEQCTKPICTNCKQVTHKDHPFVLITGFVKTFEEEVSVFVKSLTHDYLVGF
jgi:hypothetical protein